VLNLRSSLESFLEGKAIGEYGVHKRWRDGEMERQKDKGEKDVPPYTVMPYLGSPSFAQMQT
jgi:hypothetical protein